MAVLNLTNVQNEDTYIAMTTKQAGHVNPAMTVNERAAKRAFDIIVSSIVLFLVFPVMAMVAIAIKLTSEGPVLFLQERVGENGRIFKIYKFRSMVVNAANIKVTDEDGNEVHKTRHDPRVTKIGRIVRKTSLDELPQLINVLMGEMSLVGPRPELPKLVAGYDDWQYERFSVPQGITGWWQINGRSDKPCHENTDQDVYYIKNYNLLLDLKILLGTVPALLKGKGAF
ncbi:MAG: exopolysaccharide biosynthesis polyprenyl glycosylphosphotransferase [Aggregatilineales bacterium]